MPRPRVHNLDQLLDIAERLTALEGLEHLTVRRLSAESNMPNGAIYHAFGSLAALRAHMWLRAATDFLDLQTQRVDEALGVSSTPASERAVNAVVAAADASFSFADRHPTASRLLITVHDEDLLNTRLPEELTTSLLKTSRALRSGTPHRLTSALFGQCNPPNLAVITTCVLDLPIAFLRRPLSHATSTDTAHNNDDARQGLAIAVRAVPEHKLDT